jgi:hypothetical protein
MREAIENIITRKIMDAEVSYEDLQEIENAKYDDHLSIRAMCGDKKFYISAGNNMANRVERKLTKWGWKYNKESSPYGGINFKVYKEIPYKIRITDKMFVIDDNVIITNNINKILSEKLDGNKFQHVTIKSPSYALCGSSWTIKYNDTIIVLARPLISGGSVSWGSDGDEIIDGPWSLDLPDFLEPYEEELTKLANDNIDWGCCGGCI